MKRSLALAAVGAALLSVLVAAPASATIRCTISFNHQSNDLYSPFPGPAHVKFTYTSSDPDNVTINLRMRPQGGSVFHSEDRELDTPNFGSTTFDFTWPAISVTADTNYEVSAYRGSTRVCGRTFEIKPPLVRIASIRPDPFFPWIQDGYRDTTTVTFKLAASVDPTIVRVFEANATGACCGSQVFAENLDTQVVGTRHYVWNGRNGSNTRLPKGKYFVTVTGTKPSLPQDITRTSRPVAVSIARFHRVARTVSKSGIAYHHRSASTVLAAGGACSLRNIAAAQDLGLRCDDARFRVFWRWNLPASAEILGVTFVLVDVPGPCNPIKGHTTIDTFLQVGGLGHFACRVDRARLRYSFLKAS
jgi:hypothetical protein